MLSHPLRVLTGLSLLVGAAARRSLAHGYDHNSHCPAINCFRGSVGDPHLQFNGGGKADFRGRNGTIYAFLSAPRLQVNVLTEARTFKRARTATKRQLVHGSFITRAFLRLMAMLPGGKFALVRAGKDAVISRRWRCPVGCPRHTLRFGFGARIAADAQQRGLEEAGAAVLQRPRRAQALLERRAAALDQLALLLLGI